MDSRHVPENWRSDKSFWSIVYSASVYSFYHGKFINDYQNVPEEDLREAVDLSNEPVEPDTEDIETQLESGTYTPVEDFEIEQRITEIEEELAKQN